MDHRTPVSGYGYTGGESTAADRIAQTRDGGSFTGPDRGVQKYTLFLPQLLKTNNGICQRSAGLSVGIVNYVATDYNRIQIVFYTKGLLRQAVQIDGGKMQKWEYCLVQLTYPDTRKAREGRVSIRTKDGSEEYELSGEIEIFETIERLGQDGWEVVDSSSHLGIIQYIFKRPEQELMQANENLNSLELPTELLREIIGRENELRRKIIESYARAKML